MVPECLIGNKKGTIQSDVWSLGCTLLELFTEKDRREEQSAQKAGQVGEDIDHMGKANKIISIMKGQVTPRLQNSRFRLFRKARSAISVTLECRASLTRPQGV